VSKISKFNAEIAGLHPSVPSRMLANDVGRACRTLTLIALDLHEWYSRETLNWTKSSFAIAKVN
jgi:hypothetical protein